MENKNEFATANFSVLVVNGIIDFLAVPTGNRGLN